MSRPAENTQGNVHDGRLPNRNFFRSPPAPVIAGIEGASSATCQPELPMKECPVCLRCFPDHIDHCPTDGDSLKTTIIGEPVLDGRYQLERRLGQGGMGVVFKARHIFLKTPHAIKIILPDLVGNDPSLVTRFRQEAMAAAAIRHPNIIAVTDFGVVGGTTPFLVMEFVQGKSLHDILAAEGRLSPVRALEVMWGVASGLALAHRQGIVHRDLKPLNIMLKDDMPVSEGVKLLDFGLAKIKSGELLGSFVAAQTTGLMGSPYYMAPEQWSDEEPDARADIYSLGVILYQMIAGEVPFKGSSIPSIMKKHLTNPPPSLSERGVSDVPPAVEEVIRKALAKEPDERYETVELFINSLREAVGVPALDFSSSYRRLDTGSFARPDTLSPPPLVQNTGDQLAGTISSEALGGATRAVAGGGETQISARDDSAPDVYRTRALNNTPQLSSDALEPATRNLRGEETGRQGSAEEVTRRLAEEEAGKKARQLEAEAAQRRLAEEARQQQSRAEAEERARTEEARRREAELLREQQRLQQQEEELRRNERRAADEAAGGRALSDTVTGRAGATISSLPSQSAQWQGNDSSLRPAQTSMANQASMTNSVPPSTQTSMPGFAAPIERKSRAGLFAVLVVVVLAALGGAAWLAYQIISGESPRATANGGGGSSTPAPTKTPNPDGTTATTTPSKPDLTALPGGSFQMGRNDVPPRNDTSASMKHLAWMYNQWPAHSVNVKAFAIDRTEVTNAEYAEFVSATAYPPPPDWGGNIPPAGQGRWPVRNVTFEDAQRFALWRSKRDGVSYRLPTEQEWEYAASNGGEDEPYPWGEKWTEGAANLNSTALKPIGSHPSGNTSQGIVDMIGNVWEWTSTEASMYKGNNIMKLQPGDDGKAVVRGGSYQSSADGDEPITVTSRRWIDKEKRDPVVGFRLVREGAQ
ncbi:MAG: protein kinase domain-containing protein [Pyrinomonadaceae bacterium]